MKNVLYKISIIIVTVVVLVGAFVMRTSLISAFEKNLYYVVQGINVICLFGIVIVFAWAIKKEIEQRRRS